MRSIWMNAWDVVGMEPEAAVDLIQSCGLDACSIGSAYHGGRMLLPRSRRVYEQDPSALFFPARVERYRDLPFHPAVAPEATRVPPFVAACRKRGLEVSAWTVLLHNDRLGLQAPECCIRNVFGDRYSYGLCPAHPDVRAYAGALCEDIAEQPGFTRLDLEALSYMGYAHGSLHDKAGIPLPEWASWLLSICTCRHCRERVGPALDEFAAVAREVLASYFDSMQERPSGSLRPALESLLGAKVLDALLVGRRAVLLSLLDDLRARIAPMHLNLRLAPDELFCGGKTPLRWEDLQGRVDSVTMTFFGHDLDDMAARLAGLPPRRERTVPVHGGFVFHYPDCRSQEDISKRLAAIDGADLDGVSLYSLSMASEAQLRQLAACLGHSADALEPDFSTQDEQYYEDEAHPTE